MELVGALHGYGSEITDDLMPPIKELLVRQLPAAMLGYHALIDRLNDSRQTEDLLVGGAEAQLEQEFDAWLSPQVLALAAIVKWAPATDLTLVATPNVSAGAREICAAARSFGQGQPALTYAWDELYGRYTPQQLSGTKPDSDTSVSFSLFPSTYTPRMEGTVLELRDRLMSIQTLTPHLKVPSVLSSLAYFETLRARGCSFDGATPEETSVCHFDLPSQRMGDWGRLPSTVIAPNGQLLLGYVGIMDSNPTRLTIV